MITSILAGVMAALYCVAGLFFLRFWTQSRDRLFAIFAVAFWLLALQRLLLAWLDHERYGVTWLYGVRLVAFLLILAAIVDKNRATSAGRAAR